MDLREYLFLVGRRKSLNPFYLGFLEKSLTFPLRKLNFLEPNLLIGGDRVVFGARGVTSLEVPREGCYVRDLRFLRNCILWDTSLGADHTLLSER